MKPKKKVVKAKKKPVIAKKTRSKVVKKKVTKKLIVKRKPKKVTVIPKGYSTVTPYLIVNNAMQAIEFYKAVFGAKEIVRMEHSGGKVGHAELKVGDSRIMLADEYPEMNTFSPKKFGGSSVGIYLYIKDVDTAIAKAMEAGAKLIRPIDNMFYGDRSGAIEDPFGHIWYVSTHIEDVSPAQIKKRSAALFGKKS